MTVNGEATAPGAGKGSAYILGANVPSALSVIINGQRSRDLAAQRMAAARAKADAQNAKDYNDTVKFKQDGSPYFASGLEQQVYAPLTGQLTDVFKQNRDDAFARNAAARPLLQKANNETVQSESKTKFLHDTIGGFQADKNLIDSDFAGRNLSAALHDGDRNRLPSEFDAEAWKDGILGDHQLYKEPEVIRRATKGLAPVISQKIAEAGQLGGQHTADMVKGRFVAFDGKGHAVLNADGTPKLNLSADTQALLEGDPLFKLKLDAREAAYNTKRESDPSLPAMSRRGHISQMVGPLAYYDQTHDETLIRPHFARAAKAGPDEAPYQAPSFDNGENRYDMPNDGPTITEGFGGVGQPARGIIDLTDASRTGPMKRTDYAVYGTYGASPVDVSRSGKTTNKHVDSFIDNSFDIMGADGEREHREGNKQSMSGYPGKPVGAYVDAKTGKQIYPTSNKMGNEMVGSGAAKLQTQFDFTSEKGENFNPTNMKATTEALLKETDNLGRPKYPTSELASAAARKILATSTVRSTHLRSRENFADVDRLFGSNYAKHQALLDRETQRLRAEYQAKKLQPAAKPTGVNFNTTAPANQKSNYKAAGTTTTGIKW